MMQKLLLLCGIVSSLLYAATTTIVAMLVWEGYDPIFQPVSELGAIGAPPQTLMIALGTVYSILVIAFGFGVWMSAHGKRTLRIVAGLLVGYGVVCLLAPLTPIHQRGDVWTLTDSLHIVFTVADVLFILLIIVFGALSFGTHFRVYSTVTILVGIVSGTLLALDPPRFGFWERVNIFAFLLWVAIFAVVLLRTRSVQKRGSAASSEFAQVMR